MSLSNLRRYALLTGPKRCKYLRAQMDFDRQTDGQIEEPEMLGNGQQVLLVTSTSQCIKFYVKKSLISMAKGYLCQWMDGYDIS